MVSVRVLTKISLQNMAHENKYCLISNVLILANFFLDFATPVICLWIPKKWGVPELLEISLWTPNWLYGPLFWAPQFALTGKSIVQDCCHLRLTWDECVPDDLCERWRLWVLELSVLDNFWFDQCYKPESFGPLKSAQLHHFTDASQFGYGCVSYLRLVYVDGCIHCAFVSGSLA